MDTMDNWQFIGINYKYNGLLHHNCDRVWIITKVTLPKLEDISLSDIAFDPDCAFVKNVSRILEQLLNL